jgi:methionine-rich copper-binding protein CopC
VNYSVTSNNPAVVSVNTRANSSQTFELVGVATGSANVVVADNSGNTVTIAVTVPAPVALFTTAPSSLTMPAPAGALTFAIFGGTPNYTVISTNPAAVSVTPPVGAGTTYTLTSVGGGVANILISDSKGATVSIVATVPSAPALFVDAPANITVAATAPGNTYSVSISGGVAPYTAVSNSIAVATASAVAVNGRFTIQGVSTGSAAVTVKDAVGTSINIAVTVPAPTALFSTAPATLQILSGTTNFYDVYGGTVPYAVNDNGAGVVARAVLTGSRLAITGLVQGHQTVAISDAKGAVISIDVTVNQGMFTDAPASLTQASGTSASYSIYGGVPYAGAAKYAVNSSNPAVASATVSGSTLTIAGLSSGATTLVVTDSVGAVVSIAVTVPAPGALVSTAPSSLTLTVGTSSSSYAISGGVPITGADKYTVVSTVPGLVTASISGTSLTVTAVANTVGGVANVIVRDAANTSITITVTVPAPAALFTTAPGNLAVAMGPAKAFAIFGGTAPYAIVNTNPTVVSGSLNGTVSTLSITGSAVGSGSVIVSDSKGASTTIAVTVTSPGVLYTSAPSAVTVAAGTGVATFTINGGSPSYYLSSSNSAVAGVSPVDATTLKIQGGISGSAVVTVTDSAGATVTIAVTVPAADALFTNAPATINITQSASPLQYAISGGYPLYAARSADAGIVSADVIGSTLLINAVNPTAAVNGGSTTVVVSDARGQTVTINVKVGSSTALFTSAPVNAGGTVSIAVGSTYTYMVNGGTELKNSGVASYFATSSNPGVVSGTVVGPVLTVLGNAAGTGSIEVTDAIGAKLNINFTVGSGGSVTNTYPTLTTALQTSGGVATSSIDATGYNVLQLTLKDPGNVGLANQLVTVSGDLTKLSFPDGLSALTNASGVATLKVTRANLLATGAGAMTVTYDYKPGMIAAYSVGTPPASANTVTSYVGYQVTTANISLTNLDVTFATPLAAYGTRQVSVVANITSGTPPVTAPATTTPINVSFSANCGQISPSTVTTDGTGKALVTYSATDATGTTPSTLGCSGKSVQITASTSGATAVSGNVSVASAPATNISFVSATPNRIYLQNSGGVTQSLLTFRLLNQSGEGIANQQVQLTLETLNGAGIPNYSGIPNAAFDTSGATTILPLTTDASGKISQAVYAGVVPTSVIVKATLVGTPAINIKSSVLSIASGRPAQSRLSFAVSKFAIEGFNVDGTSTVATLRMSDRQGNPVPDGTAVNMIVESGGAAIPAATCFTGSVTPGDSSCSLTIVSSGTRPANGLVSILAYAVGEEDFIDSNGDNMYTCGEPFTDLGNAYRDDSMNASGVLNAYVAGEATVPRSNLPANPCAGTAAPVTIGNGVTGTFDSIWGAVDVRQELVIVVATGAADITPKTNAAISGNTLSVSIADMHIASGSTNSMPTGTSVVVTVKDNTPGTILAPSNTCSVAAGANTTIPNALTAYPLNASLGGCETGDQVFVTVTSPLGVLTSQGYTVP